MLFRSELLAGLLGDGFDAVVHAADADAAFHPLVDFHESFAVVFHGFVAFAAIHVEDDGVRAGEDGLVGGPAIEDGFDFHSGGSLREALGEELHAGVELVHARRVGGLAGDEDELRFAVGGFGGGGEGEGEDEGGGEEEGGVHGGDEGMGNIQHSTSNIQ